MIEDRMSLLAVNNAINANLLCSYTEECVGLAHIKNPKMVKFNIQHFHSEVVCDVVPTTTGHLVLGLPWLDEQRATYNGNDKIKLKYQRKRLLSKSIPLNKLKEANEIIYGKIMNGVRKGGE